nr:L [rabbit kobuvirus] [rabbit kobuvirus]
MVTTERHIDMAFQFVSVRSFECYILKTNHQSIMYWISIINNNGKLVAVINLSRRRRVNQKAKQTGANVSKPSSGNVPMGNHVQ